MHSGLLAPSQRRRHQRHHLVARVRPPRGIAQVEALPDEFGQAEVPRQGGRKEQAAKYSPALATKRRSSKVIWIRSGWLRGSIYWVLLFRGRFFATKPFGQTGHPRSTGAPSCRLRTLTRRPPSVDSGLGWEVSDIEKKVDELGKRGIPVERFEVFEHDDRGIVTFPDGTMVAWFRDPDGNMLSFRQFYA